MATTPDRTTIDTDPSDTAAATDAASVDVRARTAPARMTRVRSRRRRRRASARPRRRGRGARGPRYLRTVQAQTRFLSEFARCGNVRRAAVAAAVGRRTVYRWLEQPRFKTLYDDAHDEALDILEEEARRRAVEGVLEPVVSGGKIIGRVRKYSDNLLITLLKAKRPDVFRERYEHTGKDGGPILPDPHRLSDDELQARLDAYAAERKAVAQKAQS